METETPTKPKAKDQMEANVAAYERAFGLCMQSAERLVTGLPGERRDRLVIEVAQCMFEQFWHDQVEMSKHKPTNDLIENLGGALNRRLAM